MQMCKFGDSYDIVKQSMLCWLQFLGEWRVHPMFTERVPQAKVAAYEALLGIKVVSTEVLAARTNRNDYFSASAKCGHLFLDPNTGLRMSARGRGKSPDHLFADELVWLCEQRPRSLTLLFDQSVARVKGTKVDRDKIVENKLRELAKRRISGFAYLSHAYFLLLGRDHELVERARREILTRSKLPEDRFLPTTAPQQPIAAGTNLERVHVEHADGAGP